jgi:predicted RNA binding protein YcfA (HicA-like mRNA interferase family)
MSKIDKLIDAWRNNNSRQEATRDEVESVLYSFGFEYTHTTGSHFIYYHQNLENKKDYLGGIISIPNKGLKIKSFYLKNILKAIEIINESNS